MAVYSLTLVNKTKQMKEYAKFGYVFSNTCTYCTGFTSVIYNTLHISVDFMREEEQRTMRGR